MFEVQSHHRRSCLESFLPRLWWQGPRVLPQLLQMSEILRILTTTMMTRLLLWTDPQIDVVLSTFTNVILSTPYSNSVWLAVSAGRALLIAGLLPTVSPSWNRPHLHEHKILKMPPKLTDAASGRVRFQNQEQSREAAGPMRRNKGLHGWPTAQVTELSRGPRDALQSFDWKIWKNKWIVAVRYKWNWWLIL